MQLPQHPTLRHVCMKLRHQHMYTDPAHATRGLVDDSSPVRIYFCTNTYDALGPDSVPVHPDDCQPDRGCYCAGSTPAPAPEKPAEDARPAGINDTDSHPVR